MRLKTNRISREDFLKLKEDDILLITNPGRMGDEDGSTFIVKQGNELVIYRVDGWMYTMKDLKADETISLDDFSKQFPKWCEAWKQGEIKENKGKYKYLYMGFGNGLSIDDSIYNEFEPYLNKCVEEYLENVTEEEKEDLKYAARYKVWEEAFLNMANNKKYVLK